MSSIVKAVLDSERDTIAYGGNTYIRRDGASGENLYSEMYSEGAVNQEAPPPSIEDLRDGVERMLLARIQKEHGGESAIHQYAAFMHAVNTLTLGPFGSAC